MILFTAPWCAYCQVVKKHLDDHPEIEGVTLFNVDDDRDYAKSFGVKTIPALLKDDGTLMTESKDIITYLSNK